MLEDRLALFEAKIGCLADKGLDEPEEDNTVMAASEITQAELHHVKGNSQELTVGLVVAIARPGSPTRQSDGEYQVQTLDKCFDEVQQTEGDSNKGLDEPEEDNMVMAASEITQAELDHVMERDGEYQVQTLDKLLDEEVLAHTSVGLGLSP